MRRIAVFVGVLLLAGAAFVPAATADKPIRAFVPAEDFVLDDVCAFSVGVEILRNKEFGIEFGDGRFLITGSFKVRLTNLSPGGSSMDVNISGPGVFTTTPDDGLEINAWGNWLFWFFPGELGPQGALVLTSGNTTVIFDGDGNLVDWAPSRKTRDACALLA